MLTVEEPDPRNSDIPVVSYVLFSVFFEVFLTVLLTKFYLYSSYHFVHMNKDYL